ncbi:MAG: YitT family protein [Bacillaceae bacterium]|nr:YitT family protein [Bacillaceae bacterium]
MNHAKIIRDSCAAEKKDHTREILIRWTFFIAGLIILAFGIALTIKGKVLGIGPWDVFHYGLYLQFGLTVGSWSIIAGLLIVLFTSLATRSWPKIGTVLNMLLIGMFIDLFLYILPDPEALWLEIFVFITGIIVLAYGIGIYVAPDLGAGPRDGLMLYITEKTGWKVQWVRNGIEIAVLLLGWLLGGPVGIGTIIIAFFLGTFVGYSLPQAKKLMNYLMVRGKKSENFN